MSLKKLHFLENDNILMLVVAALSATAVVGVPLVQWFCSALLAYAALNKGFKSWHICLSAVVPPLLAGIYLESSLQSLNVFLCVLIYLPLCLYKSPSSWSVVSELTGFLTLLAALVMILFFPEAAESTTQALRTQLESMPQSNIAVNYAQAIAFLVIGVQMMSASLFSFLFMILMVRFYQRHRGKAVQAVGYIPMSHLYVIIVLGFVLIFGLTQYWPALCCALALCGPAVCSGGSWLHTHIRKIVQKRGGASNMIWAAYYIFLFFLIPWSLLLLVLVAIGLFMQTAMSKRLK